eukprot:6248462-Prymnesium_polylepis.3
MGMRAIVISGTHGAASRATCVDGRAARILAQCARPAPFNTVSVWLKPVVAHAALVHKHLAVRTTHCLQRPAVVSSREGERHARCWRPALRPAARRLVTAARLPHPNPGERPRAIHIVEEHK